MQHSGNRIKLAMSVYGNVEGDWLLHWMAFQAQIAAYKPYAGMVLSKGSCYVHMNCNTLVAAALDEPWDYLVMIQQDQIMPEGLMERVGTYTEPIVGALTFGRVMENQRAIPGYFRSDDNFTRMTDDEVDALLNDRRLHPCGAVGMGCTAIRRDVFEGWKPELSPWFQVPSTPVQSYGEDVWFCRMAAEQGFATYVDSTLVSGHVGTWVSSDETYIASRQARRGNLVASTVEVASPGPDIPSWTSQEEYEALTRWAVGCVALEIGSWKGHSAVSMAKAGAIVYAVDWHRGSGELGEQDTLAEFRDNLEAYEVEDRVFPLVGRSLDILPVLKRKFDMVFIDGNHDYESVLQDAELALSVLAEGGRLVFHDYGKFEVRPAVLAFCRTHELALDEIVGTMASVRPAVVAVAL